MHHKFLSNKATDNLEPIEISEIEGGAVENEDDNENSENDSDASDDVSKNQRFMCLSILGKRRSSLNGNGAALTKLKWL